MSEEHMERMDGVIEKLRREYNAPPEAPREDMWRAIEARLTDAASVGEASNVVSIEAVQARRARRFHRTAGWAVAAAALLVLGIGIGRMSAPGPADLASADRLAVNNGALRAVAVEHLGRTESLLTLVRADARNGRIDPQVGGLARVLLTQTRLLLDSPDQVEPAMRDLLEDLELVLVQVVGVADFGADDQERARSELGLALDGLEERDVLPRIQAVVPAGFGLAGT